MSGDGILGLVFFPMQSFGSIVCTYKLHGSLFIRFENNTIAFKINILALLDWIAEMQGERYFYRIFI